MSKFLFILFASFSYIGAANAQTEDVKLVFKRPIPEFTNPQYHDARIEVNGIKVCVLELDSNTKIATCEYKVNAGEVKIKISSRFGDDYNYVIDLLIGKTYTLVVYPIISQSWDLNWSIISESLVTNKIPELPEYSRFTFKTRVISIK